MPPRSPAEVRINLLRMLKATPVFAGLFASLCLGLLSGAFPFSAGARQQRLPSARSHAAYFQIITFKKGSSEISKGESNALEVLVHSMKDRSQKIEQAHVAVWSDGESPAKAALTPADRALAEKRIVAIESYLEGPLGVSYVESYNMAERTNWFARAWFASPHDIKSLFAQSGAPQNVTPEDFQVVKSKGAPLRAVILFELDPTATPVPDTGSSP